MGLGISMGLGIKKSSKLGSDGWSPLDEASLVTWYKSGVGVTGTTAVTQWDDQSSNNNHLTNTTGANEAAFNSAENSLTMVADDIMNTTSQIALPSFTIGFVVDPSESPIDANLILGDGDTNKNAIWIYNNTALRFRYGGAGAAGFTKGIGLNAGNDFLDKCYVILERDVENTWLWFNGVRQNASTNSSGSLDLLIDKIGDIAWVGAGNSYKGEFYEIVIFSAYDSSGDLIANLNSRLASV